MSYSGGGCFQSTTQTVRQRIAKIINFNPSCIDFYAELGIPSQYFFCSKDQIFDYMKIFYSRGFSCTPCVWCKTNPTPFCHSSHLPDVEYLLFFSKAGRVWNSGLKPLSVYSRFYLSAKEEGSREGGGVHPTIKPLQLVSNKLLLSTAEGGTVLDPFGGSGTTLIAAERTGRRCIMLEHDEGYCQAIIARWEKETGQTAKMI